MRVLYVEDDPVNRKVMQAILSRAKVVSDEAYDGQHGLNMIEAHEYDLVLMDLRMPVMDGLTAIAHIRARNDKKATVPIVVVTADTTSNIREKCLTRGADDLMQKPIDVARLFELVGRLVALRHPDKAIE